MIIVQILGGLGNQMFQYAFGRYLAEVNNTDLRLDLTLLEKRPDDKNYIFRNYELDKFKLEVNFAQKDDISLFYPGNSILQIILSKIRRELGITCLIKESSNIIKYENLAHCKSVYLSGYWQSERYFLPIANLIRSDFRLKEDIVKEILNTEKLKELIHKIHSTNSVAVHFRRGDYISDPITNKHHGVCSLDYYLEAVNYMKSRIETPHFFLFSDEPAWIRDNFTLECPFTVIENNPGITDLFLMSNCKHNIIANSSFSWWGAWLNSNSEKIIVAPRKWFNDPLFLTDELIPEAWIKL